MSTWTGSRSTRGIYPAAYPGVIAVSATNRSGEIADISVTGEKVDLAAPGEEVITASLDGGYEAGEGGAGAGLLIGPAAAVLAVLAAVIALVVLLARRKPAPPPDPAAEPTVRTHTDPGAATAR